MFRYFFDKGIGTMTKTSYDDVQHRFYAEPSAYQPIDLQRRIADARYRQSKELARLMGLAGAWVAGLFRAWLSAPAVRWYRRRKLYRELMGLDDRLLDDIGILRRDIPNLVRNAYARHTGPAEMPAAGATVHHLAAARQDTDTKSADPGRPLAA